MTGALIILLVTVGVGFLLFVYDLRYRRRNSQTESDILQDEQRPSKEEHGEICCGRHLICDKSLTPSPNDEIIYFDDEELDRFAGKAPEDYSEEEVEEVREVLMTLLPEDVAPWVRSISLRGINFPLALRDELFIILNCQ